MRFFESLNLLKSAYAICIRPVCEQNKLTRMEFDVLMFLANHPYYDTATDIVMVRRLTKSHVSVALKQLAVRGLLEPYYQKGNRKTIHLRLLPAADPILQSGQQAQEKFGEILFDGFSKEEFTLCQTFFARVCAHAQALMKEE